MERSAWLRQRRREAEERYDTLWAPQYPEKYGLYPNTSHQQYIRRFLSLLPGGSRILDAACGAGRYTPMLLEAGHSVLCIDQSRGMLARLHEMLPDVLFQKVALQEMDFEGEFDGAICMDALEHVAPEEWPLILGSFARALKAGGRLYFTVEVAPEDEVEEAFRRQQRAGWPVVRGEWADQDEVYHYYPSMQQVREWLSGASLTVLEEGEGDGYHHFVVGKEPA